MANLIPEKKSYPGQFLIASQHWATSFDKKIKLPLGLQLSVDKALSIKVAEDSAGRNIGYFLGLVIDPVAMQVMQNSIYLSTNHNDPDFIDVLEQELYQYSGSWAFILATENYQRLYLDPCGSLSAVFSSDKGAAGSTAGLLLSDGEYEKLYHSALHEALDVGRSGWLPAGLTAHQGLHRLLANHFLDLVSMKPVRHWPTTDFTIKRTAQDVGAEVARLVEGTLKALDREGTMSIGLTAGRDSRLLMAGTRSFADRVDLLTVGYNTSSRDVYVARKLTSKVKATNHRVLAPVRATENERRLWLYRASHCIGGVNQYYSPSLMPIVGRSKYFITGAAGEIGRAYFWRPAERSGQTITPIGLLERMSFKKNNELESALADWLKGVEHFDAFTILDLAYTELRVSPWAFAQAYAHAGKELLTQISPFVSRPLIKALLELEPSDRRAGTYIDEAIRALWPDLLDLPFNRYGNHRDFWIPFRAIGKPAYLIGKLRKITARA